MAKDKSLIIQEITNHMRNEDAKDWVVGLANNVKQELFESHNVNRDNDRWIYRTANTNADSISIIEYFKDIGCTIIENANNDNRIVFAYKKQMS